MKKLWLVGIKIYNTRYFIGLFKTKKQAMQTANEYENAYIEEYFE